VKDRMSGRWRKLLSPGNNSTMPKVQTLRRVLAAAFLRESAPKPFQGVE